MSRSEPARILFYPHSARAFSSSLIGHLYELCQEYPVVLLAEPMHDSYASLLKNRALFPKLERVEIISGLGFSLRELIRGNRKWHRLARDLVRQIQPQLVITENDMSSLFDMYLLREAKKNGATCLTIQGMLQREDTKILKFVELMNVCSDGTGPGLRRQFRFWSYRARKRLGHFLVHYLLPWTVGEGDLHGRSSYVLRRGASGLRDSDLNLVPTPQAFLAHTASGVPAEKLAVLPHPLLRVPHELYFVAADTGSTPIPPAEAKSILVLLTSVPVGFHQHDYSLIDREHRQQTRLRILRLLHEIFPDWRILVKPHPDCGPIETVQEYFATVLDMITILPPSVPVEPHLIQCSIILDLPLSVTTTLFTAACACPEKPIISANVDQEFYGDHYKNYPGIDYVESMGELTALLLGIKAGSYRKPPAAVATDPAMRKFTTTNDVVHYLLRSRSPSKS
jgi:hypothetical protein